VSNTGTIAASIVSPRASLLGATTVDKRLDSIRGCADKARQCVEWARASQVTIRVRRWSGGRLGIGIATDTDDVMPRRWPVRQLSQREIASSGGKFNDGDIRVSDISPAYVSHGGGGFSPARLDPSVLFPKPNSDAEVFYLLDGDQTGTFTLVSLDTASDPVSWSMVLRNTRLTP
jgi:hypothetical protein